LIKSETKKQKDIEDAKEAPQRTVLLTVQNAVGNQEGKAQA